MLGEEALLDLGYGNTLFDQQGRILLPSTEPQLPAQLPQSQQQPAAVSPAATDVQQTSLSALLAHWAGGSGSQLPEISPFKEVNQARRQPDMMSPPQGLFGNDVSPASFMRILDSGGGASAAARTGLVDAINAVREAEDPQQLQGLAITPDELVKFHYNGQRYPDILQAPDDLLRQVGELRGSTNVYLYTVPEGDMLHLAGGFYAMDPRWNETSMGKLVNGEGGKNSFLVNGVKRNLLTAAMDNHVVMLPMYQPVNPCTPGWYRERLRDNLVLLCCNESRTLDAINCVALGMFVGDQLYANTLDKTSRFQGRPDDFNNGVDNNQVLAPVHIITTLFRNTNVTLAGMLGGVGEGMELPFAYQANLPHPLEAAVRDIQAATTTPMDIAGTSRFMEQMLSGVVVGLLRHEKVPRTTVVDDTDRVDLVTKVLDLVTGHLDTDLINTPIAQANRAEKLAPKNKKRKDKFALKTVLQRAACNVQKSRLHPADHYATMDRLHADL